MQLNGIHAVIGVWFRDGRTFYVQRSNQMQNYPNVWSLLSIQFKPESLPDPLDVNSAQRHMDRLSAERLGETAISIVRYLSSATCDDNPMGKRVFLHMYQIELRSEPKLTAKFYQDSAWLTPSEYTEYAADATCGLCMRMWSDYCVRHQLADQPFAPLLHQASAGYGDLT